VRFLAERLSANAEVSNDAACATRKSASVVLTRLEHSGLDALRIKFSLSLSSLFLGEFINSRLFSVKKIPLLLRCAMLFN